MLHGAMNNLIRNYDNEKFYTITLQINNTTLPTNKEPKILGLALDPKLNYSKHIQNTTQKLSKQFTSWKPSQQHTGGSPKKHST